MAIVTDSPIQNVYELENLINTLIDDFNFAFKTCLNFLPHFPSNKDIEIALEETTTKTNSAIIYNLHNSFKDIENVWNMINCINISHILLERYPSHMIET